MLCVDSRRSQLGRLAHLVPGAVPVAISRRRFSLRSTNVGVKRKSIHVHYLAYLRIHAGRPARGLVKAVRILAIRFVTPAHVLHVRL